MKNLMLLKMWARSTFGKIVNNERGEVNIVAIVILIGIAVVLAIIFKDAILGLINSLLTQIQGNANNAINGP